MAPNNKEVNNKGSLKEMDPALSNPVECKNAPYKARATKVALPIAKPFPIAAVVFPAESRASVLLLTYSPSSAISAIPPALSDIGP